MTLILTELTPLGIAMAADSAVTYTNTKSGLSYAQPNMARKLTKIPYLAAGVSCWGMGSIGGTPTDKWLEQFIASNSEVSSLESFAQSLANELNAVVGASPTGKDRLGFHVAGFEDYQGGRTPSFFHVHDGPSTTLQKRGLSVDPNKFNANHDIPPGEFRSLVAAGQSWITRNGDYQFYTNMFQLLEEFFRQLQPLGVIIPNSQNLDDRADYLVFQIRTVSELYRMSNLVPGIGGWHSLLDDFPQWDPQ